MITETQLIRDCKRGKKSSQYLLVQRYSGMLLSVCQRYTRDEAMAKDVLQESLVRIFQHIDRFDPSKGSFEGWMRRIAIRRSIQWVQRSCFQHELTPISMPDKAIEVPAVYIDLEVADILQLVDSLPTGFRTVFNLFVIEGYSHKEIADLLGISENTSRSQLVRARKVLQEKILTQNSDRYYVR